MTPFRAAIIGALIVMSVACGSDEEKPALPAPTLQVVSLPDISSAAASVQAELREKHTSLQAAIKNPGPGAELAGAYGEMGKLFIAAEYLDAAEVCFVNARTLAQTDMRWPYYLGHVYRLKNDPATAAAFFEQTLALQADHVPSLVWLAEMHLAQSQPDAAGPFLAKAQSLQPGEGAVLQALGRVALAKQDYAQAVRHLRGALAVSPKATRLHYPLAMAYRGLGDRKKAEEHLRLRGEGELPPTDPLMGDLAALLKNAAAYEIRGAEAINERRWREAVANLRKASEIDPNNAFTRLNLGTSLYMLNDAPGALAQFQAAVRLSPGLAKAHFAIGVLKEVSRNDPEAIEAFAAAVKSDPGYTEARLSLANALRRSGLTSDSLAHYAAVMKADPGSSQASFGYAIALVRLRRYQEARDRLSDGVKAFADQPGFAHALARLLAAAPDDRVRDGRRAMSVMRALLKTQKTLAMAETMAMTLAELGQFDEAVQW
ncbi:MAG: tetratricopeptide repeat protein, partial [Burkholderiales bacterium]